MGKDCRHIPIGWLPGITSDLMRDLKQSGYYSIEKAFEAVFNNGPIQEIVERNGWTYSKFIAECGLILDKYEESNK